MGDEVETLDWLDRKLRDDAPYIDDAGFTASVMQKLPARRARRSVRSLILILAAVLASASAYVLSGGGKFIFEAFARSEMVSPLVVLLAAGVVGLCFTGAAAVAAFRRIDALQF